MRKFHKFISVLITLALGCLISFKANAETVAATQSGNWSNIATWGGVKIPGEGDIAQILVDASITITIDINVTVARIELGAGGSMAKKDLLILDTDKTLIVTGDLVWNRVGVFQQNAGSSVTAANYVFGTSGAGYSMAAWNILGTQSKRASVHGAGNIVAAAPTLPPVQQVNWQYADFDITGYIAIPLKNAWDANAYSSLVINHCYFNSTGYIDIGQYANSANDLVITNSDFRNTTSVLTGYNANLSIRTSVLSTIGDFSFEGNVFSGAIMGKVYITTIGNNREISGNVFKNKSLDIAYQASLPDNQKSLKIFDNVFYSSSDAGFANGLLIDYGGGLNIYNNLFMSQTPNAHVILMPASYSATLQKTTIHNNLFDIDDGDADIICLNFIPADIIENIFIGNGTPVNLGLSGGELGWGDLSPNSGTVFVKNNTSYLNCSASISAIAGLAWAGETSQHTGGDVSFINNLIGDNNNLTTKGYKDSQATPNLFDYIDYNWFYNGNGGSYINYEGVNKPGMTEGLDEGFGKYDQSGDPYFAHPERRMVNYDALLGGNGTELNLIAEMMKKNQNVPGEVFVSGYTFDGGLQYLREGFTPENPAIAVAGQGGTYAGAIAPIDTYSFWTGIINSDWNTPGNWSGGTVPVAADDVKIPNVTNDPIVNQGPVTPAICNNLSIEPGAVLTIAASKAITVNGTLVNNAGNTGLIVKTDGSIIENSSGVAASVERSIPANEWHLISSPVSDAVSGMFTDYYLQKHTESSNLYTDIILTDVPLTPVQGFALYGSAGLPTVTFTGILNTGEKSYNTSYSGIGKGWNLVGNPYPSSIDWEAASGWTKTNVNSATYCHVDGSTWATWVPGTPGVGTNSGSRYIAPGQGFFVQATAAGELGMTNAVRVHNTTTFFKNAEAVPNLIRLEVSGNGYKDEAVFRFLEEASAEFDGQYDAHKLFGDVPEAPQIYTLGSTELSINSMPATSVVPVGVKAGNSGTYVISATEVNDMQFATLEDTKIGIFTDITQKAYTFSYTGGEAANRFKLHFSALSVDDNEQSSLSIYSYQKTVYVNFKKQLTGDIYIYNMAGQLITSRETASGLAHIGLNAPGVYIVKVVSDKEITTAKVYIQ